MNVFGDIIHTHTRADMIADGDLVDVSALAREAGFKHPVALTRSVWAMTEVPAPVKKKWCQDQQGRLWDVLHMAVMAIRREARKAEPSDRLNFSVYLAQDAIGSPMAHRHLQTFKIICGPGDNAEPVMTILQVHED